MNACSALSGTVARAAFVEERKMKTRSLLVAGLVAFVVLASPLAHATFVWTEIGSTWGGSVTPPGVQPPDQTTIVADGGDIWGNADAFTYYYDNWSGEFVAMVRLLSQTPSDAWAKAGLMVRETTAANSRHTNRMASPLSLRKSAMVLKSGASRPVSHISSTLRCASRSSRREDCTRFR